MARQDDKISPRSEHRSAERGRWGWLFILLASICCGAAQEPARPAHDAFDRWLQQERTSGRPPFSNPNALAAGVELARTRATEMRALLETDPQQFVRSAMPAADREQLPGQLQPLVEQRVKGRGFFGVYCGGLNRNDEESAGHAHPAGYGYEVRIDGKVYKGSVFGKWRDQTTVIEATIEGVALGDAIALGDAPTPAEQAQAGEPIVAGAPSASGANTLLYIIARFSDQTNDPVSEATARSQMTVVSNFWLNNSSDTVSIRGLASSTDVFDVVHVTLPLASYSASNYNANFSQLLNDARNAASSQGFNYANYNLDVTVTTGSGFGYAGRAWIGAQGSHVVSGYTSLRTVGHELGHNQGLYHADYWRTDSTQPFGRDSVPGGYVGDASNAEWVEYGHYFSVMSAQSGGEIDDATKPHYAAAEKVRLGWLSGSEIQYVSGSGTYRLFRHDARTTVGTPRAIRIETASSDYTSSARRYWLNYRYAPWSAQNWLRNGVQIDVCQSSYGGDGAILLDMSPFSNDDSSGGSYTDDNTDKVDSALIVGRTYTDRAGIHITPIATGSNGTNEEYIDIVVNLGTFSGNRPPIISSLSLSTNQVGTGQSVNFNVSATDPDGDTLAYSWDFDQGQTFTASGLNSAASTKNWPSAGQYRVMVTVSDMKGGVATESAIITVGNPSNKGQIWGRVVWAGQPVYRARVFTPGYIAWTDSDGSYVLTDLSASSNYVVSCSAAGLTFTPQFSNPVSLAAGDSFGNDFYANEQLMPGGGTGMFDVTGQVTDGSSGVQGAEVRGAGMVALTDVSGNYRLSNIVAGTYTVTVRKDNWTFSPSSRSVTVSSSDSTGNNFSRVAPYSISGSFSGVPAAAQSPAPTIYLSNGRSVQATRQGTGGNRYWGYTISSVPAGQFSLNAELSGYTFTESFSNPLTVSGNLSGMNFTGTASGTVGTISGRVTERGLPLVGATVRANQGASTIGTALTDSDGYYRISDLPSGAYIVVASKVGYSFSPSSISVNSVSSSGNNFSAFGPNSPPTITSVTANPGTIPGPAGTSTLSVTASGAAPLSYSWDALIAPGPVTFTPNDSGVAASTTAGFQMPGSYTLRARVTDVNGFSTTSNRAVTVSAGPGSMVVAPYETQVPAGQTFAFQADAWDQLGNAISVAPTWSASGGGTIDGNGVFSALTQGGPYFITAVGGGLSATGTVWVSAPVANMPPMITTQPAGLTRPVGSNATFTVSASGTAPLAYQWRFNGSDISGATATSYTRSNLQRSDAGNYSVQVSNVAGTILSSNALLTVPIAALAGALVSSTNPALPAQPVVFTLTLAPVAPASGTASGAVQFRIDGAAAGSPVPLAGNIARYTNAALSHGAHVIAAEYAGDTNFSGTTNVLSPNQVINTPPVAGPNTAQRDPAGGVKVSVASLLANDSDADSDVVSFVGVAATSVNGGTIVSNSGWIHYSPAPGFTNVDSFTYNISDGFVSSIPGTVTINVRLDSGPPPNISINSLGGAAYLIRGDGLPDRTYRIEYADALVGPWQTLGNATANENGLFQLNDSAGSGERYYRAVYP